MDLNHSSYNILCARGLSYYMLSGRLQGVQIFRKRIHRSRDPQYYIRFTFHANRLTETILYIPVHSIFLIIPYPFVRFFCVKYYNIISYEQVPIRLCRRCYARSVDSVDHRGGSGGCYFLTIRRATGLRRKRINIIIIYN